jgi:hypothetical protein
MNQKGHNMASNKEVCVWAGSTLDLTLSFRGEKKDLKKAFPANSLFHSQEE